MAQPNNEENQIPPIPPNRAWVILEKLIEKFPKPPVNLVIPSIVYLIVAVCLYLFYIITTFSGQTHHSNLLLYTFIGSTVLYLSITTIYFFLFKLRVS